ncbi:MAG: S8 family serine peptidase, partial [Anaerolineae bacterium]|nr:S8 family serine peptidase [Anaerolineae bacterium]
MKSKTLGMLIVIVMVVLLAAPVGAVPAPDRTGLTPDTGEAGVYIVRFEGASLASYEGGIPGLEATSPAVTGEAKLDVKSPASVAYLDYLANRHAQFIAAMERTLDRSVEVLFRYDAVLNGMAVRMTGQEAAQVAALPGIVDVQIETIEYPDTDVGPTWIGAPGIWDGSAVPGGIGTEGEGVIVGVIDTGINHDHPSFADVGGDGYDHTNPWGSGTYVGYCVTDDPNFCNDKLIGAWNFAGDGPEDTDGHGSHTSSTAAGNHITATITTPSGYVVESPISGVAPHANIIMYDACITSCPGSALLASAQQALLDGVDAINYSISGGNNPYGDSVELAFLDLNTAGVFVSTSAGNAGPGAATVAHRSAWVSTVAAATHNRLYSNALVNMTGGGTPPADIDGQSISTGVGPAPIVYAGDYGDPLCGSPFAPGTWTNEIVVCDRGTYGRVEKGANVLAGGADGYVLANDAASGDSLVADP